MVLETRDAEVAGEIAISWDEAEINSLNSGKFQAAIQEVMKPGISEMVIDLRRVNYINAAGLATMVRVTRIAANYSISIRWKNVDKNLRELIRLTRLDPVIKVL